eukprot:gnl/TRDRNA2_/TRDRNA2_43385_c0_seq1.p1 gnl/TRDRNA2_/TRDRNA2_43385_c0~~gnl/TRDRNA2_/TRDRNA2_43385_c0_seq1.p1  ORF type:complete len:289 (+),score=61.51 gnl/TRDRNA2_/TRDRNA2_43385_c0_seq1:75-941(+)
MQRMVANVLLAVVVQANAKEIMVSSAAADKVANDLFIRALKVSSPGRSDLDSTTLGKSENLEIPDDGTQSFTALLGDQCARRATASWQQSPSDELVAMCSHEAMSAAPQRVRSLASRAFHATGRRLQATGRRLAGSERTYVMVKPDGVQRGLVGEIISRFEKKGFYLKGLKMFQVKEDLAKEHYKDLSSKPFFPDLVQYICSGPVVCMVWEGKGVVASSRKIIGATNPLEAEPGTIRGDFAVEVGRNLVHGSDTIENGEREVGLWFGSGEGMADWTAAIEPWLRELKC